VDIVSILTRLGLAALALGLAMRWWTVHQLKEGKLEQAEIPKLRKDYVVLSAGATILVAALAGVVVSNLF
jgi:hypothetical protein